MLHAALDQDCKGAPLFLCGRGIRNSRAGALGLLHRLLYVFDGKVRSHDRLLMRCHRLPDAHKRVG
jgi:hypothetical protein